MHRLWLLGYHACLSLSTDDPGPGAKLIPEYDHGGSVVSKTSAPAPALPNVHGMQAFLLLNPSSVPLYFAVPHTSPPSLPAYVSAFRSVQKYKHASRNRWTLRMLEGMHASWCM